MVLHYIKAPLRVLSHLFDEIMNGQSRKCRTESREESEDRKTDKLTHLNLRNKTHV